MTGSQQFIAIDSPTTRDVDDAIAIAPDGDGWRLGVLIADAASLIPPGTAEDDFAQRQGATVYQGPRAVQTMLPRAIAEDKAALAAGKERSALRLDLRVGADFGVTLEGMAFVRTPIHAHVPYTTVASRARDASDPLSATLRTLVGVSQGLLASRRQRGALAYYDLSRLVMTDEEGRLRQAESSDDAIGQIVVQEVMILTNAALATWAVTNDVPVLFRNHRAKAAAPAADVLARNIQEWMSGSALNAEVAREQLDLVLGVATYGASVESHFALNLPAYLHGTSPIRRYADLVNQRQFHAALTGAALPYTKADLDRIAVSVNDTLAKRREERKEGFKATIVRRATTALDRERYEQLADHELSQAIKIVGASGSFPEPLADLVARRIVSGALADTVLDRLMALPPGSLPASITGPWATTLDGAAHRAKHLIMFGVQTGLFSNLQSAEQPAGTGFKATASVSRASDGLVLTSEAVCPRKQDAINLASARLVMAHLGVAIPKHQAGDGPATDATAFVNSKGRLMERCQKRRWTTPQFTVTSVGATNEAIFTCKVTLEADDTLYAATSPGCRTRIQSEHAAAAALLEKLSAVTPAAAPRGDPAPGNPIGEFQEHCAKRQLPMPRYDFSESGGEHVCTVSSKIIQGGKAVASAALKQDAKKAAAARALGQLVSE